MKLGREAQTRWQWLSSLVKEFRLVLGSKEIREGCEVRDVLSISKSDMQCGLLDILLRRQILTQYAEPGPLYQQCCWF